MRGNAHYRFIYNVIFQDIAAAHREPKVHSSQQWNLCTTHLVVGKLLLLSTLTRRKCHFSIDHNAGSVPLKVCIFRILFKVNFKLMTTLRGLLAQLGQNLKSSAKK